MHKRDTKINNRVEDHKKKRVFAGGRKFQLFIVFHHTLDLSDASVMRRATIHSQVSY